MTQTTWRAQPQSQRETAANIPTLYPFGMARSLAPSIFNDVIGPIMRGPSSSHSAASVRGPS